MSLMPVLLWALGVLAVLALANRYQFWRPPRPRHWPRLLMYHSIADAEPTGMNTPPARFDAQLAWLKRQGYSFCTVSELLAQRPARAVAITFDDGFANNYHQAFPLLKKHGAKATIYLAPDIADIDKLTAEQIHAMQASGLIEFGAHSLGHVNLAKADEAQARAEIEGSKARVEALTGAPCSSFAYPFGRFTDTTVRLVGEAGFASAVTTKKRIIADPAAQALTLPRISTHGAMDLLQFRVAFTRGRFRF